jgi:hypothetical protein
MPARRDRAKAATFECRTSGLVRPSTAIAAWRARLYSQGFDLIDASARLPAAEISAYIVPLCKASKLLAIRDILRLWLLVLRSTGLNCARER